MRRFLTVAAACALATLSVSTAASAQPAAARTQRSCSVASVGFAACHAWVRTDLAPSLKGASPQAATPSGLFPADLRSAYGLTALSGSAGAGVTVGIVDAFDDPSAFADVNTFRSQFGIPALTSCTPNSINASTTACFAKSNQNGGTSFPRRDGGWAEEISLDVDMVSALCPKCNILLVEATNNSLANLGTSVNRAVTLGADVVSNSYGGGESSTEATQENQFFNHPGIAVTASSGDAGFGVEFPAASRFVTAVGGTSLVRSSNARGWSETVWNGAGSGCSAFITKPTWQHDTGCARRTVADVSAVADPATGVAVFDSFAFQGLSGWLVFGGTSVAAPVVGAIYALGGTSGVNGANLPYAHTTSLNDVTSGSNGSCSPSYLCTGTVGYDGPTGLGTPNGAGAF